MSWVLMVSIAILGAAVMLIEMRAIREVDENQRHAPGFALIMGGLVMIGIGIAAAVTEGPALALLASSFGLVAVVAGATRSKGIPAHR
jgi:hypothetical protein